MPVPHQKKWRLLLCQMNGWRIKRQKLSNLNLQDELDGDKSAVFIGCH